MLISLNHMKLALMHTSLPLFALPSPFVLRKTRDDVVVQEYNIMLRLSHAWMARYVEITAGDQKVIKSPLLGNATF